MHVQFKETRKTKLQVIKLNETLPNEENKGKGKAFGMAGKWLCCQYMGTQEQHIRSPAKKSLRMPVDERLDMI